MTNNLTAKPVGVTALNENESIDYGKLKEESSREILDIPDDYDFFISHASAGEDSFPSERMLVETIFNLLNSKYPDRVYLDLKAKPKIIPADIFRAAQSSKYGLFICSPRYIKIFHGKRKEPYKKEYDVISGEVNIFLNKQRLKGFCVIPVQYGVNDSAFTLRSPFGGNDKIKIEDEIMNEHIKMAEFVVNEITEKVN